QRGGVHRIRNAERAPAVAAAAAERDAKAARAERAVDDALITGAVERDHGTRAARVSGKKRLGSAQVAVSLLAGRRHEVHRRQRGQRARGDRLGEREHYGETAPVVADAGAREPVAATRHARLHLTGEYGIQMRAQHHGRAIPVFLAGASRNDVPRRVRAYVVQPQRVEARRDPGGAARLAPRGSRDFGNRDLRLHDGVVPCGKLATRAPEWRAVPEVVQQGFRHGHALEMMVRRKKRKAHGGSHQSLTCVMEWPILDPAGLTVTAAAAYISAVVCRALPKG